MPPTATTKPPAAKRVDHLLEHHGHQRHDPYYWMRDDQRKDKAVLDYLAAENAYTAATMSHTRSLQKTVFDEVVARIAKDDASVPYLLDGYWHYRRYEKDKEQPIFCRKKARASADSFEDSDAEEEIVLDANRQAAKHKYYSVAALSISRDGNTAAYAEDTLGRRIYTIRFKDMRTQQPLADRIEGTAGDIGWSSDGKTLLYVSRERGTLRAHRVYAHRMGTPRSADKLLFEESDETFHISLAVSTSRRYFVIGSYSTLVYEQRTLPIDKPLGAPRVFLRREAEHEYTIEHGEGDAFFVLTNWRAQNFRLMKVALSHSGDKTQWQEVVPAQEQVLLHDFALFSKHLVLEEREHGLRGIRVVPKTANQVADLKTSHRIASDEAIYTARLGRNPRYDTTLLRFQISSLATPMTIYDYQMSDKSKVLKKRQKVLGPFDANSYRTERLEATARDGQKIPISLVYSKRLDRSRPQPLYLYGYGSYGHAVDPTFDVKRLSLLDRGFIYAIAHVRGGEELGRQWYESGKLLNKRNTFTDFIDCATYLTQTGYTDASLLVGKGGSAGGLLTGAVANMAPEQFAVLVSYVPFVDVVTTMLDESIPLTTFEYDEWGNPNQKEYYDYMLSYSPYDQVRKGAYPHMIVFSGLHDSQVQYWEPTKWVAKLRANKTDNNRLLLRTNMEAGHSGASGRFRRYEDFAMELAFVLDVLSAKQPRRRE